MVMTYKQGLLAFSFLAAISGGCTYNEDDLHARHPDNDAPPDRPYGSPDLPGTPGEIGAASPADAAASDAGVALDAAGDVAMDSHPTPSGVDAEIDSSTDASDTQPDRSTTLQPDGTEDQSIGASLPDASDLPTTRFDAHLDALPIEVHVTEAGGANVTEAGGADVTEAGGADGAGTGG